MAARRRSPKTRDLPPNLYIRNDGYFSYRDPRTGKEFGLGRDKRYAVTEAVEANRSMLDSVGVRLVDRISGGNSISIDVWSDRYIAILERRNISKSSMTEYRSRINAVRKSLAGMEISGVSTKDVAAFLDGYITAGKPARARLMRSTMLDMFREAIADGVITTNPVEATRNARITVKRSRLSAEEFSAILAVTQGMPEWVRMSMELAVLTAQRVSDISKMAWCDVMGDHLRVEQKKTGMKLSIPLSLEIPLLGLSLRDTLERCIKALSGRDTLIASRTGKALSVETISRAFAKARGATGIKWEGDPPSFHELRSLSARLHAAEKGNEYAQRLLGHKSAQMSERYIDSRGSEWLEVR